MPVRLRGGEGKATKFLHICDAEGCDKDASFGFGVHYRRAMDKLELGQKDYVRTLLGKWYCLEHRGGNEVEDLF
jgi:hypothetical protein